MDDLRTLRKMRADAPEPDAERLTRVRDRVFRAAPPRRTFPRWRLLVAGVVTAAAAVALLPTLGEDPPVVEPPVRLANTKETLEKAASVVETRKATPVPRADQWQYHRHVDSSGRRTKESERWTRYDGQATAGYGWDGQLKVTPTEPDPGDDDLSPEQYDRKLRALPTDPGALLAHVRGDRHWIDYPVEERGRAENPDARAFRVISLYLRQQAVMPPDLEAALFRALAMIPGVKIEQNVADAVGRTGFGVYHTLSPGHRSYIILSPGTYRYLGVRHVFLRDVISFDGHVMAHAGEFASTAELAAGIVDRPGQRP